MGIATVFTILFGVTYSMGGAKFAEYKERGKQKDHLTKQIKLNQKIIADQSQWMDRLTELQAQLRLGGRFTKEDGEKLELRIERLRGELNRLEDRVRMRSAPGDMSPSMHEH